MQICFDILKNQKPYNLGNYPNPKPICSADEKEDYAYKGEISKYCYKPAFTSKEKMSDREFELAKERLKNIFDSPYTYGNYTQEDITEFFNSKLNKSNIHFVEKLLSDKRYHTNNISNLINLPCLPYINDDSEPLAELIYFSDTGYSLGDTHSQMKVGTILSNTDKDTADFAMDLWKNKEYFLDLKSDIMQQVNKENISLAQYLMKQKSIEAGALPKILETYNTDPLKSFCEIVSFALNKDFAFPPVDKKHKFPDKILRAYPDKFEQDDIDFIHTLYNKATDKNKVASIIRNINSSNIDIAKDLYSYDNKEKTLKLKYNFPDIDSGYFPRIIIEYTGSHNAEFVKHLLADTNHKRIKNKGQVILSWAKLTDGNPATDAIEKLFYETNISGWQIHLMSGNLGEESLRFLANHDPEKRIAEVKQLQKIIYQHPERYVSGNFETVEDVAEQIDSFFSEDNDNNDLLMLLYSILDKDAVEVYMRRRLETASEDLYFICVFSHNELEIISKFNKCTNLDGKPFLPAQKLGFIDLMMAYRDNNADISKIKDMVNSGKVDLAELHLDLLKKFMENLGYSKAKIAQIPNEKLMSWDLKYSYLLSKQLQEGNAEGYFKYLIDNACFYDNFKERLHAEDTEWGKNNNNTRTEFTEGNLDYEKWLNPSEDLNIRFEAKDENGERIAQIASQLADDIEHLRKTAAGNFVDKQLANYIKENKFVLPEDCYTNKIRLKECSENIIKQLNTIWKRAQENIENPQKAVTAKNTLTIYDHLQQKIKDLDKIKETKAFKNIDWTIKMWDRIPQKDLFQGNYSTCCIGIGNGNGEAMPLYLMHTAFNMIEIKDNATGNIVGNALCYFAWDTSTGKPVFIIDNIEINNSEKPSKEIGLELRNAITQYAKNITKSVAGNAEIPVYLGKEYNDVPDNDLPTRTRNIAVLGYLFDISSIYLDVFGGWIDTIDPINKTCKLAYLG